MKEKVLVKFQVTNPKLLAGIPPKKRNEEAIQAKRAASGFENQGVRKGVVDTGNHREYQNVSVSKLINTLRRNTHPLTDLHYFIKGEGYNKKYVVVATFDHGTPVNGTAIDNLVESAWGHCHVWFNPNDTITVNCLHRMPAEQRPTTVKEIELPV